MGSESAPGEQFHEYCTSPLFTITSSDGDKYHIHSALLIKHSPVFKQLIEGPWKESGAGGVEWTEYSSTTVSIFAEWLYTGKYGCVYPEYVTDSVSTPLPSPPNNEDIDAEYLRERANAHSVPPPYTLSRLRAKLHEELTEWPGFRKHKSSEIDFTKPFQVHTRMYALAQYLQIPGLEDYAYYSVVAILSQLEPSFAISGNAFARCVAEVYLNVDIGSDCRLSKLLTEYAASNHHALMGCADYCILWARGGEFVLEVGFQLAHLSRCVDMVTLGNQLGLTACIK